MIHGLYALLAPHDAPPDPADSAALGLHPDRDRLGDRDSPCQARGHDPELAHVHLSRATTPVGSALLLGYLTDAPMLERQFGLPSGTPPALIVHHAWQRHGKDMALHLDGEWSFIAWDGQAHRLIVALSTTTRDPLYYASDARSVAVAPSIITLARLRWCDASIDTQGLALHIARAALRTQLSVQTPIAGVHRVPPGGTEIFGAHRASLRCAEPALPGLWTGSYADALPLFDDRLRHALRQQMAPHRHVAVMLSGGLDSSVVAYYAQAVRAAGQSITCYTSVAPEGSGLSDEADYAALVTERLGLRLVPVVPPPDASVFIPTDQLFDHGEIPAASPRHYLYEAFYARAGADGASLILDGAYGEGTITCRFPLVQHPSWRARLLEQARRYRHALHLRGLSRAAWLAGQFHPYLAADMVRTLARFDYGAAARALKVPQRLYADAQFGFSAGMKKNRMTPTGPMFGALRHGYPFRDQGLIRLMAAMPAAFTVQGGFDRAIARSLIDGHLPDAVVKRKKAGEFSPDFKLRLSRQSGDLLDALPQWQAGLAGDWLDLKRLEAGAIAMRSGAQPSQNDLFQLQATAICAAYLHWLEQRLAVPTPA